jgi:hypothetical protein
MGTSESALSQDVVFDILSSSRRRYVLYRLRETEGPVELTKLAEQVAAWENDTDTDQITEQERKRVYVSLYQTHIPRLDEVGLVVYDRETGQIELAEEATQIDDYLSSGDDSPRWEWVYLGLAAGSAAFLAATALGPLGAVADTVATGIVVIAFVLTAGIHATLRLTHKQSVPPELRERE